MRMMLRPPCKSEDFSEAGNTHSTRRLCPKLHSAPYIQQSNTCSCPAHAGLQIEFKSSLTGPAFHTRKVSQSPGDLVTLTVIFCCYGSWSRHVNVSVAFTWSLIWFRIWNGLLRLLPVSDLTRSRLLSWGESLAVLLPGDGSELGILNPTALTVNFSK